jgi:hypothetical protein
MPQPGLSRVFTQIYELLRALDTVSKAKNAQLKEDAQSWQMPRHSSPDLHFIGTCTLMPLRIPLAFKHNRKAEKADSVFRADKTGSETRI